MQGLKKWSLTFNSNVLRYAPIMPTLPTTGDIVGQGGDLTNYNINCPSIWSISYNQIPLQKGGGGGGRLLGI